MGLAAQGPGVINQGKFMKPEFDAAMLGAIENLPDD